MRGKLAQPDEVIAEIAGRQHGVVARRQLLAAGLSGAAVERRTKTGRLHRVHQGVYAVGYRSRSWEGRWMATVLACGEGAALSHRSAAALWGQLPPVAGVIDVSTPARGGRSRRAGIRLHRRVALAAASVVERQGIPVLTPARTLADLRGTVPAWEWRRAARQAELKGFELGTEAETERTRSDLERDFLRLCRRHGIPDPEVNVRVGRWTVDFLWRRQHVAVETDSYTYHRGRVAFQDDRARDLDLRRHGFAVHRFSERQVNERPEAVAADLRDALGLLRAAAAGA